MAYNKKYYDIIVNRHGNKPNSNMTTTHVINEVHPYTNYYISTVNLHYSKKQPKYTNVPDGPNKWVNIPNNWDDSIKFMGDSFTAVIRKNILSAIHPTQDRFLNLREILHLMGFPHDFEIQSVKQLNHIAQTVPVNTARDWTEQVITFCQGNTKLFGSQFVKQDNVTRQIIQSKNIPNPKQSKKRKVAQ